MASFTVEELAKLIGAEVEGDAGRVLSGMRPLDSAGESDISFLDNAAYVKQAQVTKAGAIIVHPKVAGEVAEGVVKLLSTSPYAAFAKIQAHFHPVPSVQAGFSATAVISNEATVHATARVEPGAVVYAGATIGAGTHIGANTVVGEHVSIGANCRIAPNVTLLYCTIGDDALIHAGVCIGQDGYGFAEGEFGGERELVKVPQVGMVRIGNDVEIGGCCTIDRGAMADTILEDSVKLDCQVQIGHNAKIGHHTRIVAQVGIAGSTKIGAWCVIGGQSGIVGHLTVADGVMVAARSGVIKSIPQEGAVVAGSPALPIMQWRKLNALLSRISKNAKIRKNVASALKSPISPTAEDK